LKINVKQSNKQETIVIYEIELIYLG